VLGDQRSGWHFEEVTSWRFAAASSQGVQITSRPDFQRTLPLSPLWIEYRSIEPAYIPVADLARLAASNEMPDGQPHYADWLEIRRSKAFYPGLLAALSVGIFYLLLDRGGIALAGAAALLAGYAGFALTRVAVIVADHQFWPQAIAVWSLPALLLLASSVLFTFLWLRDQPYTRKSRPS
jgi:lipopolysaccharide export LptBFGC system permease protein LptF